MRYVVRVEVVDEYGRRIRNREISYSDRQTLLDESGGDIERILAAWNDE